MLVKFKLECSHGELMEAHTMFGLATQKDVKKIERRLDHVHDMLHALADVVAGIAQHTAGGMTAEECAQVATRLKDYAQQLRAIAAPPPVT